MDDAKIGIGAGIVRHIKNIRLNLFLKWIYFYKLNFDIIHNNYNQPDFYAILTNLIYPQIRI